MAIAIKNIPLLKEDVAVAFDSKAEAAIAKKSTVKFTKQLAVSAKILKKAKFQTPAILAFLYEKCTLQTYNESILKDCVAFDCGNPDLNEFFSKDVHNYTAQLLGKSYCFTYDEDPSQIVAAFTISNDSIKTYTLPNARKKKVIAEIPRPKQMKSYPAVLIGRLGVNKNFRNLETEDKSIGDQLMDFIKSWFIDKGNKTGCRFIVVDAYNTVAPLKYYRRNGFTELFSSEEQEKEFTGIPTATPLNTRLLYYDLILLAD